MTALLVHLAPTPPSWWFVLLCAVALAMIPLAEWVRRSPARRRIAVMLGVALVLGAGVTYAALPPPDQWADCCDWLIPYGICWPIWWGC